MQIIEFARVRAAAWVACATTKLAPAVCFQVDGNSTTVESSVALSIRCFFDGLFARLPDLGQTGLTSENVKFAQVLGLSGQFAVFPQEKDDVFC